MDEKDEADKGRFQNERGLPYGPKPIHQNQAMFDTSQDGELEQSETEIRQGRGHGVNVSHAPSCEQDQKHKHDDTNHGKQDDGEREVTDPVTHLPVMIHDFTSQELKNALENIPLTGSQQLRSSKVGGKSKIQSHKTTEGEEAHAGMERLFAPGDEYAKTELIRTFRFAVNVGIGVILLIMALIPFFVHLFDLSKELSSSDKVSRRPWADAVLATIILEAVVLVFGVWSFRRWVENKLDGFWVDQAWKGEGQSEREKADANTPESTQWLNSLLASIWPLVNPELFASLADTLEDSMQASLPKLVNMINVEDLGQGSEAPRILGVRWLPSDATGCSVSGSGKLHGGGDSQGSTEYEDSNSQQENQKPSQYTNDGPQKEQEQNLMKVVEAEEGDFVSLEIAFAYRARPAGRKLSTMAKNAHLFLAIYLPTGIRLPIWVEIRGIVGMLRLRLQLTPDPPFLAQSTFTLMGQPKVDLSCMPVFKHGLNIMNLPIISSFIQTSVDTAIADYVAPKSLTLDLKDIIMAEDFKKDTSAHGVVVVRIKRATGFKGSATGLFRLKKGSVDPYVSLSWTKFGKSAWATRVIVSEMEPIWDETGFIIIGPKELNAQERLRVQLWDANQTAANNDLGFIDIGLNEVMQTPRTNGKMWDRRDALHKPSTERDIPCILDWSVGYFSKRRISPTQIASQTDHQGVKNVDYIKDKTVEGAPKKLPKASRDESHEIQQQKVQDLKAKEDEIFISSPPSPDYYSGIFAIQIHQILGLGFKKVKRNQGDGVGEDDDQAEGDDLLSSYCTVILNHQKIFKTRTKPKSAKPSFNVGAERFIRDWRTAEVILSVRDLRMHEHDPLVGIVVLPLAEIFKQRSQINDYFSLSGGIGRGRVRISMVFRSIQLQVPRELLGWEYGTLQITSDINSNDLPNHYKGLGLKLHTSFQSDRMRVQLNCWSGRQGQPVELAVQRRYCSSLVIQFVENIHIHHHIPAFAILWLKDIPDDEEKTVTLPVWKGDLKRAEANCGLENGDKLGHIEVHLKFRPGISDHHKKLASKDRNLEDVMEVLCIANDNKIKVSLEEAAFDNDNISNHEDGHQHDQPQTASKEHEGKLHRTTRKVMQWKVGLSSNLQVIAGANIYQSAHTAQ
ncbi:hypothetical protein N7510_010485 [Penicillium lagena]|uniref:uncharacterized protein n=1 Tax=Penicillium lagena TaxID=94218 RepID=UPI00254172FB|nr:uncharacterized protein N7510_010485 [Penicillium lagena]KAJ5605331.1 hypothetical protein N7510_010485 [Penicillium lagena]